MNNLKIMNYIMTHIICGSKPYHKINFSDIIDNNFKDIYRCNMLLMGNIYEKLPFRRLEEKNA